VAFLPVDDEDITPPAGHSRTLRRRVAVLVSIAGLIALVFAVSSGGDDNRGTSASSRVQPLQTPPTQAPQGQPPQSQLPQVPQTAPPQGFGGADLTGPAAVKAAKAAVAKFPGNVERVTQGPTGSGYVVHVIDADGYEVHVLVSDKYKVLGSDAGSSAPPFQATPPSGPSTPG
jgi:hypothetical protein